MPRIAVIGSTRVRALAARLAESDVCPRALAFDGDDPTSHEDLGAFLGEPGTQDDVIVTVFETDAAAHGFFAGKSAGALRGWPGAMLDASAITPVTLRQIVPKAPDRFCAAAFGQRPRDGEVSSVLYIEGAALAMTPLMRIAGCLADDVVAVDDAAKVKALAIVEGLLVGVNAAIVDEALALAEASGVASETIIPLILEGSGATTVMALRGRSTAADFADGSGRSRNGLLRAFVAAREVEHPLLFASVANASHACVRFGRVGATRCSAAEALPGRAR